MKSEFYKIVSTVLEILELSLQGSTAKEIKVIKNNTYVHVQLSELNKLTVESRSLQAYILFNILPDSSSETGYTYTEKTFGYSLSGEINIGAEEFTPNDFFYYLQGRAGFTTSNYWGIWDSNDALSTAESLGKAMSDWGTGISSFEVPNIPANLS